MTRDQQEFLRHCNGFGRIGSEWCPYIKRRTGYFTPSGLRTFPPSEWRDATHAEIVAEMDKANAVPVVTAR